MVMVPEARMRDSQSREPTAILPPLEATVRTEELIARKASPGALRLSLATDALVGWEIAPGKGGKGASNVSAL